MHYQQADRCRQLESALSQYSQLFSVDVARTKSRRDVVRDLGVI